MSEFSSLHSSDDAASPRCPHAAVIGASGGIGAAFVAALTAAGTQVHALSRPAFDLTDEASIAAAAAQIGTPLDLVIVATGTLVAGPRTPEKAMRDLSADSLARYFAVNATGPALVAKHFLPLLARDPHTTFAALSARVGSISDNRLGGWYGYRASKAALNMLIATLAIELARTRPQAICVGLHPGTVDTRLSAPFQRGVADLFTPERSAAALLEVLARLTRADSGGCFDWRGERVPA